MVCPAIEKVAMSEVRDENNAQPSMLARAEEIQQQIQQISGRDLQLWSIGILLILVLTGGLLTFVFPSVVWTQRVMRVHESYLPQLFLD